MTSAEINKYRAMATLGLIEDELNPIFIFGSINTLLLRDVVSGKIDACAIARMELENRGIDPKTGKFIGWKTEKTRG